MHQYDPERRPDTEYEPGRLGHLVPGNQGRALDPRRTPVRILAIRTDIGFFRLEVLAFEDAGATWDIPLERVGSYQFERGAAIATPTQVSAFQEAVTRLDRGIEIVSPAEARDATERRLDELTAGAQNWLACNSRFFASHERLDLDARTGPPALAEELRAFCAEHDVLDLEQAFAEQYVRHPSAGEIVKGHRIVIAELGLVPYRGSIVRDPTLFDGAWSKQRRAEHVVHRLAFVRATFARAGLDTVVLYRGMCAEGPIEPPINETFVSASFDFEVAKSCFGETDRSRPGALFRQAVPVRRVFMTYLETREMNLHYREAEAVLLHDAGNPIF